jgi:hypothetical protein
LVHKSLIGIVENYGTFVGGKLIRNNLKTYGLPPQKAFESLCNQIFEVWVNSAYQKQLSYFSTVRGDGGDGGVESFAELGDGSFVGLQAKWFDSLGDQQIIQIRKSITSALRVRPQMLQYIVCLPIDLTNKKTVKGKKVTDNHEANRWKALEAEVLKAYPSLKLDLWTEHDLIKLLQREQLQGANRFWVGTESFTLDLLRDQFEKARASWLSQRYLPDLHVAGKIYHESSYLVRAPKIKAKIVGRWEGLRILAEKIQREVETFKSVIKKELDSPVIDLFEIVREIQDYIQNNIERIANDLNVQPPELKDKTDYNTLKMQLRALDTDPQFHSLSDDLNRLVEEFYNLNPIDFLTDSAFRWNSIMRIFAGNPGTGKTHALANITETRLSSNAPTLLIQAKSVPDPSSWKNILQHSLGLGSDWSEDEIFSAMSARANILEIENRYLEQENQRFSCFVICVDGLDEADNWEAWQNRISEINYVARMHFRLRFIITARPYMLRATKLTETLRQNVVMLPPEGDINLDTVFDKYMAKFNIDVSKVPWVRWNIRSPLALHIFCELNAGKTFAEGDKISTTLGELLRDRVKVIEAEVLHILGKDTIGPEKFLSGLLEIASIFLNNRDIKHDNLHLLIKSKMSIDEISATKVIGCLVERAIIVSYRKGYISALKPGDIFYQPAFQAVIESLISIELADLTVAGKPIPHHLLREDGILEITAALMYGDHDILPAQDGLWGKQLPEATINRLRCIALAASHPAKTVKQKDWVVNQLTKSMPLSRAILATLCFPLSRIPQHPLGPLLVHEVLVSFERPAERDLLWSGLDYIPLNNNAIWEGYGPNPIKDDIYSLKETDEYDGLPLLHVWNLSSVDNNIVDTCSKNLTSWGSKKPSQFLKLFKHVMPTNDPQINEALLCCAYGIASVLKAADTNFYFEMAGWLLKNVFSKDGLVIYRSSVVRATGRAIVERAAELGLIPETDARAARPPFALKFEMLSLNTDAAKAKESYGPIWHDLAWYVIKSAYRGFFEPNHFRSTSNINWYEKSVYSTLGNEQIDYLKSGKVGKLSDLEIQEIDKVTEQRIKSQRDSENRPKITDDERADLLEMLANSKTDKTTKTFQHEYFPDAAKILEVAKQSLGFEVTPHQLTLGAGIAFIEKLGWSAEVFYGKPNGGQQGEILGADLAITRKHFMSSHGSRSNIMSFGEKYVWAAVHYLQGYFSDYIEYSSYDGRYPVTDYSLIEDFQNPAQLVSEKYASENRRKRFILPSPISPSAPEISGDLLASISNWVQKAAIPDFNSIILPEVKFTKHLTANQELALIYSFVSMTEITGLGNSLLWLHTFLIDQSELAAFKKNLDKENYFFRHLIDDVNSGMTTGVECDCYITPRDVIFQSWKKEIEPRTSITIVKDGKLTSLDLEKCICKVTTTSIASGERSYELPAKALRSGLGIVEGDGVEFYNVKGELVAINSTAGAGFKDSQDNLYVDRQKLMEYSNSHGKVPIWLVRFDRRQSTKAFHSIGRVNPEISHYRLFYLEKNHLCEFSFESESR